MALPDDERFMKEALLLARSQMGKTSPDPMVGAVIVKTGKIISRGYHSEQSTPHAESYAIKKAGNKAKGSTLYLNLEPCCHYGFNPPCTSLIIKSGIKRVVAAMQDPNPFVSGKGFKELRSAGIKVDVGLMKNEARRLNEPFIKHITSNVPFVILKSAMSLDGKIATVTKESKYISSKISRQYVHLLRVYVDAILTTVNTVKADDPLFTVRDVGNEKIVPRNPKRIVLDPLAEIPLAANILRSEPEKTIVVVTNMASRKKIEKIRKMGAVVITARSRKGKIDLKQLMIELGEDNIMSVMIEAGGNFAASALNEGIVDKAIFFIVPKIIGGKLAPTPVEGKGIKKLSSAVNLNDVSYRTLGNDIVVEGYVRNK